MRRSNCGAPATFRVRIRHRCGVFAAVVLATAAAFVNAAAPAPVSIVPGDDQVVASRGGVSVTLREIDARIMELPRTVRAGFLNDPNRIEETINGLLMEKQLAKKAVDLGIEDDRYFTTQLEQAKTRYMAARARQLYEEAIVVPDLAALAEEKYLANPENYGSKASVDVTHVLVNKQGRTEADAIARAEEVRRRALAGEDFGQLVAEFTDEKSRGETSKGILQGVTSGVTVPEFERAAYALKQPGDISDVVKTKFGYHVIKLDRKTEAVQLPFAAVQPQILKDLQGAYLAKKKSELLDEIRGMKIEASEPLVASLRDRYTTEGPKSSSVPAMSGHAPDAGR